MQGTTLRVLLCTGLVVQITRADVANNELLGSPVIQCNAETIEMRFATKKEFQGKVYVKGSYSHPECRAEYSTKTARHSSTQGIKIEHGACNMSRQRLLFITKADKIFTVRCMYKESSHSITANLDVSMLPSEQLPMSSVSPTCAYTIRRDSLDGEILAYAKVGDQVVHRWNCDTEEFGILVHSCVVEDGQGQKELIVDEQGCHTDRLLLGDPTYVAALNMAYREASIFKFADRISVRFRCEIRLCFKFDGGCEGVTPPLCNRDRRTPRSHSRRDVRNETTLIEKRTAPEINADLLSQTVVVFDGDYDDGSHRSEAHTALPHLICLGFRAFAWTSAAVAAGIVLSMVVAFIQYKEIYA